MNLRNRIFMFLAATLVCATAFAQTTASLTGIVTTEGSALPGVTVTISSPALQGTRTTVTGDAGGYSFPALPPGTYKVRFELAGMAVVDKVATLNLSQPGKIDADMKMTAITEAITVTASAPTVLESPQVAATLTSEEVEALPVPRTFEGAALLAPGVNANTLSAAQFQISGSPGYDNLVMVNGVSVTESVRSQFLNLFIEDAVQETTVLTGAISAEYGRFTGGVVNSLTKSGGNQFSGSFRDSFSNPSWTDKTPYPGQADPIDKTNQVYEATLGGFIMKDRLWFFGAGRTAETSGQASTRAVTSTNPLRQRAAINYTNGTDEDRYEVKLTGQITAKHNLVGSYIKVDRTDLMNVFNTSFYDLDSLYDRQRPDSLKTATYNGVITNNLLIEAQWSARTMAFVGSGSIYTDLQKGTLLLDRSNGTMRYNSPTFCGVCDKETRNNDSKLLKANYFLSTKGTGNHNMVIGLEEFAEQRYANNHQSGSDYRIYTTSAWFNPNGEIYPFITGSTTTPGFALPTYIRWTPIFEDARDSQLKVQSFFVNDKWDFNSNWSFNVGFRYDKNNAVDGSGNTSSDDSALSPRLTALFDPKGNGRHRFSLSYNTYVSRIVEGIAASNNAAGNPATIDFAYNGPTINPPDNPFAVSRYQAIQMVFDWFFAQCVDGKCGPNNNSLLRPGGAKSVPGYAAVFQGSLKSPAADEISLGYAAQIGTTGWAKFDYINREWKNFYGNEVIQGGPKATTPLGIPVDLTVVTNTDDVERKYEAFQIQAGWRPQRWNFGMNYTYATLEGNDEGETSASGPVANLPLTNYYPEFLGYANRLPVGPLAGDQRHRLRAWAGYDVPLPPVIGTLNVSVLQRFDSGVAYSQAFTADIDSYTGAPSASALGYLSAPGEATYYLCRGCERAEDEFRTDLAVNYARNIWKTQFFVQADLLNVFNADGLVNSGSLGQTISRTSTYFNPFTQTPVAGTHYNLASNYGKATSFNAYQLARTYQISAGFRF